MAKKPNSRVAQLRAEVKRAHRAATQKISRAKSSKGVVLAGSEFDPRGDIGKVKVYTAKQLESQLARLKAFTARNAQFVADAKKNPIPLGEWKEYKAAETVYNNRVLNEFNAIKDVSIQVGNTSMTVGERAAKMRADHPLAGNPSVKAPHNAVVREPFNIKNRAALKKLTKDAKRKMDPEYDKSELKRQQAEMRQILDAIKSPKLDADIKKLTGQQFNLLWNWTPFADAASTWYEMVQKLVAGEDEPWHYDVIEKKFQQAKDLVKQAATWETPDFERLMTFEVDVTPTGRKRKPKSKG